MRKFTFDCLGDFNEDNIEDIDYVMLVNNAIINRDNIKPYINELFRVLRFREQQVSDILHYIELGSYNGVEGWKLLKALKNIRCERRCAKDAIKALKILRDSFKDRFDKAEAELEKAKAQIDSLEQEAKAQIDSLEQKSRIYIYRSDTVQGTLMFKKKYLKPDN